MRSSGNHIQTKTKCKNKRTRTRLHYMQKHCASESPKYINTKKYAKNSSEPLKTLRFSDWKSQTEAELKYQTYIPNRTFLLKTL